MGPSARSVRRGGRARHVATLGPSRRAVAIRLAHVGPRLGQPLAGGVGHTLGCWQVSRRCGPPGGTTPYDPTERLGPRLGWRQRPGRPIVVADAPHVAADRKLLEPSARTDRA